jgi:hypothetical protein
MKELRYFVLGSAAALAYVGKLDGTPGSSTKFVVQFQLFTFVPW